MARIETRKRVYLTVDLWKHFQILPTSCELYSNRKSHFDPLGRSYI